MTTVDKKSQTSFALTSQKETLTAQQQKDLAKLSKDAALAAKPLSTGEKIGAVLTLGLADRQKFAAHETAGDFKKLKKDGFDAADIKSIASQVNIKSTTASLSKTLSSTGSISDKKSVANIRNAFVHYARNNGVAADATNYATFSQQLKTSLTQGGGASAKVDDALAKAAPSTQSLTVGSLKNNTTKA